MFTFANFTESKCPGPGASQVSWHIPFCPGDHWGAGRGWDQVCRCSVDVLFLNLGGDSFYNNLLSCALMFFALMHISYFKKSFDPFPSVQKY